ncbi:glycosyltransferase family 2 protein [Shewanella sp. cp20]|uniref:glycosyltransferase family 2 protein n=1 Tax=Shewanella sp. cp20 TaxID=1521167 RepID=UPI00069BEC01|nr:glycosyltransferase [Shewanella sp. cp20]
MRELVSVVIRTLNEEKHLEELLTIVGKQVSEKFRIEVVIVDSGSSDNTLLIAKKYNCRITYIDKSEFTFGRSLNFGCEFANGQYLVFVSGHCIPTSVDWIEKLVSPLADMNIAYTYGRQVGRDGTKFSERQLFSKYFPIESQLPQKGIFCNNANSALRKDVWEKYNFDETLTGCEDMFLAKELVVNGYQLGYVAEACVFHIHDETWNKVKVRYEREALALQKIMPEIHLSIFDTLSYIFAGILKDIRVALRDKVFFKEIYSILMFRYCQYSGAYRGNHIHRKLSKEMKMKYFYPRVTDMSITSTISKKDIN